MHGAEALMPGYPPPLRIHPSNVILVLHFKREKAWHFKGRKVRKCRESVCETFPTSMTTTSSVGSVSDASAVVRGTRSEGEEKGEERAGQPWKCDPDRTYTHARKEKRRQDLAQLSTQQIMSKKSKLESRRRAMERRGGGRDVGVSR